MRLTHNNSEKNVTKTSEEQKKEQNAHYNRLVVLKSALCVSFVCVFVQLQTGVDWIDFWAEFLTATNAAGFRIPIFSMCFHYTYWPSRRFSRLVLLLSHCSATREVIRIWSILWASLTPNLLPKVKNDNSQTKGQNHETIMWLVHG